MNRSVLHTAPRAVLVQFVLERGFWPRDVERLRRIRVAQDVTACRTALAENRSLNRLPAWGRLCHLAGEIRV